MIGDGIKRSGDAQVIVQEHDVKRQRFTFEEPLYLKVLKVVTPVLFTLKRMDLLRAESADQTFLPRSSADLTISMATELCLEILNKVFPEQRPRITTYEEFPQTVYTALEQKRQRLVNHLGNLRPGHIVCNSLGLFGLSQSTPEHPPSPFGRILAHLNSYSVLSAPVLACEITEELTRFIIGVLDENLSQLKGDLSLSEHLPTLLKTVRELDRRLTITPLLSRRLRIALIEMIGLGLASPEPLSSQMIAIFKSCITLSMASDPVETESKNQLIALYQKGLTDTKKEVCEALIFLLNAPFTVDAVLQIVLKDGEEFRLSAWHQTLLGKKSPLFKDLDKSLWMEGRTFHLVKVSPDMSKDDFEKILAIVQGEKQLTTLAEWISLYTKLHPLNWIKTTYTHF